MKKIMLLACAIALVSVHAFAQDIKIPPIKNIRLDSAKISSISRVTKVAVFASPGFMEGCNNQVKHFEFTAVITVSGPCTVQFRWERSDGAVDANSPRTLTFTAAGSQTATQTWDLSKSEFDGWQAVTVIAPNSMVSNKAPIKIYCCAPSTGGCATNPFTATACTQSLFTSFKNLAAGVGVRICNTSLNFPSVSSTMPENCFTYGTTGVVSYTSFYTLDRGPSEWRVIWGSVAGNYTYYGVCAPDPIIFPRPGGGTENHVFGAKFIKRTDYQAFSGTEKNYVTMAAVPAIRIADIVDMSAPTLEESTGYMNSTEHANYENILSSKGLIVTVRLRDGSSHVCYIINNYDGAGTVTWKQRNPACK